MKVSIIIATKNCKNLLSRCLDSIIKQTNFENVEILISDNNSIDGTLDIIYKYKDFIYWYQSENDLGIADAWNKAIKHASGDWLFFMGADDMLYKNDTIENLIPILSKVSLDNKIAIFSVYQSNPVKPIKSKILRAFWDKKHHFNIGMNLSHQGIFHRKILFDDGLVFNINLKYASDYELLLRVLKNTEPYVYKNLICANQEIGGLSSRFDLNYISYLEFKQARKINNIDNFSIAYFYYLFRAYAKYLLFLTFNFLKNE
jgi:glycosyltransferase involved in cell wall biosynthesis